MARGDSGRIVIEVDPDLKSLLYVALARENLTLKGWFIREVERYVEAHRQPALFAAEPQVERYRAGNDPGKDGR